MQASSGVGGQGSANILIQCVFKSFWSQEEYFKSDNKFEKVTDILRQSIDGEEVDNGYFAQHFPTDKEDLHNYTLYYDELFAPYVKSSQASTPKPLSILEVGVKKGGSMKLWRELFGWDSMIYGVDIDPGVPSFIRDAHMKTLVFDSRKGDIAFQSLRGLKFDIIIDDGDHTATGQQKTLYSLWPFLKDDGIYIIEDLPLHATHEFVWANHGSYWSRHMDKTEYEHVLFLYPEMSRAPRTVVGLF
jgi:hypothetical protein